MPAILSRSLTNNLTFSVYCLNALHLGSGGCRSKLGVNEKNLKDGFQECLTCG